MARKVSAWRSDDGQLYEEECEAIQGDLHQLCHALMSEGQPNGPAGLAARLEENAEKTQKVLTDLLRACPKYRTADETSQKGQKGPADAEG